MLTARQTKLLVYIDGQIKTGICPSYGDMRSAMGLASKSGVNRLLNALEERGFIRRIHFRARAIEVIRLPGKMTYHDGFMDGYRSAMNAVSSRSAA